MYVAQSSKVKCSHGRDGGVTVFCDFFLMSHACHFVFWGQSGHQLTGTWPIFHGKNSMEFAAMLCNHFNTVGAWYCLCLNMDCSYPIRYGTALEDLRVIGTAWGAFLVLVNMAPGSVAILELFIFTLMQVVPFVPPPLCECVCVCVDLAASDYPPSLLSLVPPSSSFPTLFN